MVKRKAKVQQYKARKAKEHAALSRERFINPRDVSGVRGHELREGTLGAEYTTRGKAGGIVDKREGGDDATEVQMLGRMRKVKEKSLDKYTLNDSNEVLTHYGSALGEAVMHEGGEDTHSGQQDRRKPKEQVFEEIIEKSRAAREEKKQEMEEKADEVKQLDSEWRGISSLMTMRSNRKTAVPSAIVPTTDADAPKRAAKVLVIGKDGSASTKDGKVVKPVDSEIKKQMADIMKKVKKENKAEEAAAIAAPEPEEENDEYDTLMMELENATIAKAGSRTKSSAELAAEAQAQLIRLQREKTRKMRDGGEEDEDEPDQLYQPKYKTTDSLETKEGKARRQASGLFEGYLTELEEECKPSEDGSINIDFARIDTIVQNLKKLTGVSPVASAVMAKDLLSVFVELIEAGAPATPFALLVPSIFIKIFPPSDFRHPVCTPLALYLGQALVETPLDSLRNVTVGLFRAGVLLDMGRDSRRYCGEVLVLLCNVLSLAGDSKKRKHDEVYEPTKAASRANKTLSCNVPMLKGEGVSLAPTGGKKKKKHETKGVAFKKMFCTKNTTVEDTDENRHALLHTAYALAKVAVNTYNLVGDENKVVEGVEYLEQALLPLKETLENIQGSAWMTQSTVLESAHVQLLSLVKDVSASCVSSREPLKLQTHRPVPIPLYNLKITEYEETEADERRALKQEYREQKKKAIRDIRADSRFLAQKKDKERQEEMAQREDTLKHLTVELQAQRKMTKDSDVAKEKLKAMQKKAKK